MTVWVEESLVAAICELVDDLRCKRFDAITRDGRGGRLTAEEIETALREYGRTLVPLPDEGLRLINCYPDAQDPRRWALDVPLWTREEGRSDLTLSIDATKRDHGYLVEITGIHVL